MKAVRNIVTIDVSALSLMKSFADGVRSRALFVWCLLNGNYLNKRDQSKSIQEFYRLWRYKSEEQDIVDLSSPLYGTLIAAVSKEINWKIFGDTPRILDLGCGSLTFFRFLRSTRTSLGECVGVDLEVSERDREIANDLGVALYQANLSDTNALLLGAKFDIISCINLLSYVEIPDTLTDIVDRHSRTGGNLLVVEPIPSLYWENYFSDIRIALRSRLEIEKLFSGHWRKISEHTLRVRANRLFHFDIASAQLFSKL